MNKSLRCASIILILAILSPLLSYGFNQLDREKDIEITTGLFYLLNPESGKLASYHEFEYWDNSSIPFSLRTGKRLMYSKFPGIAIQIAYDRLFCSVIYEAYTIDPLKNTESEMEYLRQHIIFCIGTGFSPSGWGICGSAQFLLGNMIIYSRNYAEDDTGTVLVDETNRYTNFGMGALGSLGVSFKGSRMIYKLELLGISFIALNGSFEENISGIGMRATIGVVF